MFIYIILLLHYLLIKSDCFVLKDMRNEFDGKKINNKRDVFSGESEYEMINKEQLLQFNGGERELKNSDSDMKETELFSSLTAAPDLNLIVKTTYMSITKSDLLFSNEYNYEELVQEYYVHSLEEAKSEHSYHVKHEDTIGQASIRLLRKALFLNALSHNCTKDEAKGIGIRAAKCLIDEYRCNQISKQELLYRLWRIIKIWLFIYLVVAIPLWVTRGWCCCCLSCKFFKPHRTIQKAKIYLVSNPPGIFKDESGETQYKASEKEKEKYEEFEHLLRTI